MSEFKGPWHGRYGQGMSRFVVRNSRKYFEFLVYPGQKQLSIPVSQVEKMQQDEWDWENSQRNLRMKGKK